MVSWAVTGATRGIGVSSPSSLPLPCHQMLTHLFPVRLDRQTRKPITKITTPNPRILTLPPCKSSDPSNQVFAIIRSRATAGPLEKLSAERKNIHLIVTDISDPKKLAQAAAEVGEATGGSLDVLLLNAGSAAPETAVLSPSAL
jgi:hypothetical protein